MLRAFLFYRLSIALSGGFSENVYLRAFNPNRSLDFGEIARLCHAACFWPSRRRSGLRRGVARRSENQDADRGGQDARKPHFPNQKRTRRV